MKNLICPPYRKNLSLVTYTGLIYEGVKDASTFGELWVELKNVIEVKNIIAYNLAFDWRCLTSIKFGSEAFDVMANVKHIDTME